MDNQEENQIVEAPQTSGMAITALVFGILSLFTCGITSIPAIILGHMAHGKINRSNGKLKGGGLAIAGFSIGYVFLILLVPLLVSILMPALGRAREMAKRIVCASNLKTVSVGITLYQNDYDNALPDTLETLIDTEDLTASIFVCPSSDHIEGENSYIYRGGDLTTNNDPKLILVHESLTNHNDEGCNVLFADSQVIFLKTEAFIDAIEADNEVRRSLSLPTKEDY